MKKVSIVPVHQVSRAQEGPDFAGSNSIFVHEFQRQRHRVRRGGTDDHMIDHVTDHVISAAADCQKNLPSFLPGPKGALETEFDFPENNVAWGPPAFPNLEPRTLNLNAKRKNLPLQVKPRPSNKL